jgi:hypothetical protein
MDWFMPNFTGKPHISLQKKNGFLWVFPSTNPFGKK